MFSYFINLICWQYFLSCFPTTLMQLKLLCMKSDCISTISLILESWGHHGTLPPLTESIWGVTEEVRHQWFLFSTVNTPCAFVGLSHMAK